MEFCQKCFERVGEELEEKGVDVKIVEVEKCLICSGILYKIDEIANDIINALNEYEFNTFLVGCKLEGSIKVLEEYLIDEYDIDERKSIKFQFNRELVNCLTKFGRFPSKNPDVTILYNLERQDFEVKIHPIYLYGRYIKRVRGLSQTRWLCNCKTGCRECNYTGRRYLSVEELIGEPCIDIFKAKDAVLHGAGREDVDARMLGSGRPFVLEIVEPKKRNIDLSEVEKAINDYTNKVRVKDLKFVNSKVIEFLKDAKFKKTYRAKVIFEKDVSADELFNAIEKLKNVEITQRTPKRVEHRRADLIRKRKVYDMRILQQKNNIAVLEIEAESGLYIKELISGDDGRTKPSLSEVVGIDAIVEKLDVINVEGGLEEEALNT